MAENQTNGNGRARLYRRKKQPEPIRLTRRDQEVLAVLAEHRLASGDQLRRLLFRASASKVRRRLRALFDHGLIERRPVVAVPTQGIPPFVYTLSNQGCGLLHDLGTTAPSIGAGGVGLRFVHHRYLVVEFYVSLVEASRQRKYGVRGWRHEEGLKVPASQGGLPRAEMVEHPRLQKRISFLPDGFFELDAGHGRSFAYFVEVDRATHPQRVWRERAQLYAAYADPRTGLYRRRFGRETFRLLIVTTPDYRRRSRRDNILKTIRNTIGPSDMFLATTFADMTGDRLLGPVWRRADGTDRDWPLAEAPQPGTRGRQPVSVRPGSGSPTQAQDRPRRQLGRRSPSSG